MKSASHVFVKGVWVSFLGFAAFGIVNFFTRRLLAHTLDRDAYGFFYSAFAFASVFVTLIGGGVGHSVMVLVSRYRGTGDAARAHGILGHGLLIVLAGGVAVALAGMAVSPWLLSRYFGFSRGLEALVLMWWFVPGSAMLGVTMAALNAVRDYMARNVCFAGQYLVLYFFALFGVERHGLTAVAMGLLVSQWLLLCAALPYAAWRHGMISFKQVLSRGVAVETWQFSAWTMLSATCMVLMSNLDALMLTKLAGLRGVAIYNIALPVVQVFLLAMVVPWVFAPIAADLWYNGKREELAAVCRLVVSALTIWGVVLVLFLIPAAKATIGVLFGAGFDEAAAPLVVLGAGVPMLVIGQFYMHVLAAIGKPAEVGIAALVSVGISAALNVTLIPVLGVVGAATATALAYGAMMFFAYRLLVHHMRTRIRRADWTPVLIKTVCCGVPAVALTRLGLGALASLLTSLALVALFLLLTRTEIVNLVREGMALIRGRPSAEAPAVKDMLAGSGENF